MNALDITTTEKPNWHINIPGMLRSFGAAAILFSLYNFLFKGWEGSTDLIRYLMLLGHTVLLAVLALGSGKIFKEGKGPRVMMMLALVSVPVNFAILGAFIAYANALKFNYDIPSFVYWSISDYPTAIATALGAAALLIPISFIAFRTLVRDLSKPMSLLFIVGNALLLIPIRDAWFASFIGLTLAAVTLLFSNKTRRQRTESKTFEGMMALLLLFLPAGIMLGRDLWLHNHDASLVLASAMTLFIALRHFGLFFHNYRWVQILLEGFSVLTALAAGISFVALTGSIKNPLFSTTVILGFALSAAMIYEIAYRKTYLSVVYRLLSMAILLLGTGVTLCVFENLASANICLVIGMATAAWAHKTQERSLLISGILIAVGSLVMQATNLYLWLNFSHWIWLGGVGMIAIVLGSMLEARGERIKQSINRYKTNYADWRF